ncbi:MAG: hypothetical protein V4714_17700 [Bacteroidota bacterium]
MKTKSQIAVGDKLLFSSGNYEGLTGEVISVNWESKDERAMFGYLHRVRLSNGEIGNIEKSEHWSYVK